MDIPLVSLITATTISVVSLGVAMVSQYDAKRANRLAEIANETARESLDAAERANLAAEHANQIAEDANRISSRALQASTDNLIYEWGIELSNKTGVGVATITNNSPHDAMHLTVIAECEGHPVGAVEAERLPGFGQLHLNLAEGLKQTPARHVNKPAISSQAIVLGGRQNRKIVFHIQWQTPLGVPRSHIIKKSLRNKNR
ncbi:hypothetical protein [Corynebacterium matruchotii]|uniref:hypothetical protein n=1 Tax=Corynebacterium matruchotii TaxID=43768 RepID=UPI003C78A19D